MSRPTLSSQNPSSPPSPFTFDPVSEAITAISNGEFVVVMDDADRENEGDLICAGSKITTEGMAWMIRYTSGFICLSLPPSRLQALSLPPLLPPSGHSQDPKNTAYHLTLDANPSRHSISTGISAHDRSYAVQLIASGAGEEEFTRPGHLVTLRYTVGGTRVRRGHTEAAVDLCYLAGEAPAGLLCELVNDDEQGSMARRDDCWAFARRWGLRVISIADLAEYVGKEGTATVPSADTS